MIKRRRRDGEISDRFVIAVGEAGRRMSREAGGFTALGVRREAQKAEAGLHIVATPIGNLGDITLRALEVLAGVDLILAEDTRHSRRLLDHYGIATPLSPYHEHNAERARPEALRRLAEGQALALISDAGTPLISDPGFKLAAEARKAGFRLHPLPGASAMLAALVAAGLPTDRFLFEGFLPPKTEARRARLNALAGVEATLVFYEAPQRLGDCLADLAAELGSRPACVARELTKLHETLHSGDLGELAAHYADREVKGEIVLVVGPPGARPAADAATISAELEALLAEHTTKDAAAILAARHGLPRRDLYAEALALSRTLSRRRGP
jgi:16S rRNA (cytidine1402-2'-O)-methyltransferase